LNVVLTGAAAPCPRTVLGEKDSVGSTLYLLSARIFVGKLLPVIYSPAKEKEMMIL
jgi:hypothetical protein